MKNQKLSRASRRRGSSKRTARARPVVRPGGTKARPQAPRPERLAADAGQSAAQPHAGALPSAPRTRPEEIFPIVGIGASAGGLEALEEFLRRVPTHSGMAFVIVQHQPRFIAIFSDRMPKAGSRLL